MPLMKRPGRAPSVRKPAPKRTRMSTKRPTRAPSKTTKRVRPGVSKTTRVRFGGLRVK